MYLKSDYIQFQLALKPYQQLMAHFIFIIVENYCTVLLFHSCYICSLKSYIMKAKVTILFKIILKLTIDLVENVKHSIQNV